MILFGIGILDGTVALTTTPGATRTGDITVAIIMEATVVGAMVAGDFKMGDFAEDITTVMDTITATIMVITTATGTDLTMGGIVRMAMVAGITIRIIVTLLPSKI